MARTPRTTAEALAKAKAPGKMAGKVPQIMQMEALECGAASVGMVLAYYGKWISLEELRRETGVSRDGSKASNLVKYAQKVGLKAKGRRSDIDDLRNNTVFPCIVHWNFSHFIVVRGFKGNKVYVNDPARGEIKMSLEEFDRGFTGVSLRFEPTEDFMPGGKPPSVARFLVGQMKRHVPRFAIIAVIVALVSLAEMLMPRFSELYMNAFLLHDGYFTDAFGYADSDTESKNIVFYAFAVLLGMLCLVQVVLLIAQQRYTRHTTGRIAAQSTSSFFDKAMRLPVDFYKQRSVADIADRADANTTVAQQFVTVFAPLAVTAVMMIVYLVIMVGYSVPLGLIGLLGAVGKLLSTRMIAQKSLNSLRCQTRSSALLAQSTVAGITSIESLKAAGAEAGFFRRWSGYQAACNRETTDFVKLTTTWGLIPSMITSLVDVAVVAIGILLVINGHFTTGSVLAFQGYLSSFMAPVGQLATALDAFQHAKTDAERIQDVMESAEDPLAHDEPLPEVIDGAKLRGAIDLVDVSFGYSSLEAPLLDHVSIHVEPGESIAFVGPSGCGKSTLVKLISGLYQPWSGQIRLDGVPLSDVSRDVRTNSVAVIDQEVVLFEDTIANNIRLWDDTIDDISVTLAARDAQIHADILARPDGYENKLSEGGRNLSGGQRQRIDIARALAAEPTILLMDEATSALDTLTEGRVIQAVKKRGITTVMVAHRHSTIRDCDQIIVMEAGKIVARGRHEELMADHEGLYYRMVTEA